MLMKLTPVLRGHRETFPTAVLEPRLSPVQVRLQITRTNETDLGADAEGRNPHRRAVERHRLHVREQGLHRRL